MTKCCLFVKGIKCKSCVKWILGSIKSKLASIAVKVSNTTVIALFRSGR